MVDKWIINCGTCEEQTEAKRGEYYAFICTICGRCYHEDDITAYNLADVERYRKSFEGAKIAGMIPDPEFEGDKEQMKKERW